MSDAADRRAAEQAAEYVRELEEFRREKDQFFAASSQSPIPAPRRHGFPGLSYYPPDPAYRVRAEVVPFEQPEVLQLGTSTGDIRPQARYAELRFRLGDRELRLAGFTDPDEGHTHELFVPFRDATSGGETYGAGRYLEVELEHHTGGAHSAILDFNLAYNPYCAYSPYYSCPIPPAENTLPVAVTAGERDFGEGH